MVKGYMSQELFKWKLLEQAEAHGKKVAEISVGDGKPSMDDRTKTAMAAVQREILDQHQGEKISLIINLNDFGLGGLSEALHFQYIHELSELSHQWEQLIVYTGNRLVLGTASVFASISGITNFYIRSSREDAIKALGENKTAE
jgi:hypothetical protein